MTPRNPGSDRLPPRFVLAPPLVGASLAVVAPALGQVNADGLRLQPLRPGWSANLEASVAVTRGNVELFDVGGGGRVQWQSLRPAPADAPFLAQRVFLTVSGRYADRAGTAFVSQSYAHLRWTAMWHPRVGTELFAQDQSNQFQRLQARVVTGGGLRFVLVQTRPLMAWAGAGLMLEYNRLIVAEGRDDPPETWEPRAATHFVVRVALLDGRLFLQDALYVQPRLGALSDVRLLDELEVLAKASEMVSLGVTATLLYDSAPPSAVAATDGRVFSVLKLAF